MRITCRACGVEPEGEDAGDLGSWDIEGPFCRRCVHLAERWSGLEARLGETRRRARSLEAASRDAVAYEG